MTQILYRVVLLLLVALLTFKPVKAQFFVNTDGYCPEGEGVEADTIFNTHNKAMPFDRCFTLKHIIKGKHDIKYFVVNPIDKYGKVKIRKRDHRVYIKSGWPKEKREQAKIDYPYDKRQPIITRLHKVSESYVKGENTVVVLKVPPLDPGRNYKIILFSKDTKAAEDLFEVGELIFKSELDSEKAGALRAEAMMQHNQSLYKRDTTFFSSESFKEFQNHIYTFKIIFNQPIETNQSIKGKEYRLFFTPKASANLTKLTAFNLSPDKYLSKVPSIDPETIVVVPKFINDKGDAIAGFYDTQRNPIILNQDSAIEYKISLLVVEKNVDNPCPELPVNFYDIGELKISQHGTHYSTSPDPQIPDGILFKIEPSPLIRYLKIKTAEDIITKIGNDSQNLIFDKDALHYLMEQTLITLSRGLIDTTVKDNLSRDIPFLFEQKPKELENTKLALSLKNFNDKAKENQYQTRKENIKISIEQVNLIQDFIRKVKLTNPNYPNSLHNLELSLKSLEESLENASKELDVINSTGVAIKEDYLNRFKELNTSISISTGSTSTLELMSENKFRIVPVFGYVGIFRGDNLYSFQDFTPYLGFHINFRPLDKNIPSRNILYKSWHHRLSFMSGLTLRSLEIANKRDDLFGDFSLLTGIGFRLNNYFTVTGGTVWFKATDENPLSDNKPLRFSPYVGLSLDLILRDLFAGISNPFK